MAIFIYSSLLFNMHQFQFSVSFAWRSFYLSEIVYSFGNVCHQVFGQTPSNSLKSQTIIGHFLFLWKRTSSTLLSRIINQTYWVSVDQILEQQRMQMCISKDVKIKFINSVTMARLLSRICDKNIENIIHIPMQHKIIQSLTVSGLKSWKIQMNELKKLKRIHSVRQIIT